jgi:type I restriction enzyme S subunit
MPHDQFTFDDLRGHLASDYESLKGIVFELLGEADPSLRQVFDTGAQALRFVRLKP